MEVPLEIAYADLYSLAIGGNYYFSAIFSLTLLWDPLFIWVLGEIYWGTAAATKSRK